MALDASADETAILERLSVLWGGRVLDELPDESELERDEVGVVKPYIVLTFGVLFPSGQDRSLDGEDAQPHVLPFVAESWGPTKNDARAGAYGVIRRLTGFKPTENSSEIALTGGGGGFANHDQGRPVMFMRPVAGMCIVNMQHDPDGELAP